MKARTLTLTTLAASLLVSVCSSQAQAAPNGGHDFFNANTTPQRPQQLRIEDHTKQAPQPSSLVLGAGSLAQGSQRTPVVEWFEGIDAKVAALRPSPVERVILEQPFNQEAERVQRWTLVAGRVSTNYKKLAKEIKLAQLPPGYPGLSDYRDLTADWYLDTAKIYDDLICPRQPAKTQEELDSQLEAIHKRAEGLHEQSKTIHTMDMSLRKTYKVHLSRQDDALSNYVRGQRK